MEEQDWIFEEVIDSLCQLDKHKEPIVIIITEYEEEEDCD